MVLGKGKRIELTGGKIIALVWVSLEADSETQVRKQVPYLGWDSRKHWQETMGSETEGKEAYTGCVLKHITAMVK